MADKNILDLSQKLIDKKLKEGPSFIYCAVCGCEESGFAAQGRFNEHGAYYIERLICLSDKCLGESDIEITGGFVV